MTRELHEELGIRLLASRKLIRIHHDYGDRRVLLDVRRVTAFSGVPEGREGQPLAWVHPQALDPAVFPAADRPIITALRMPPLYLVTGGDARDSATFLARLERALAAGVRLVQLRAHQLPPAHYARLARAAHARCTSSGARLLLNAEPAEAARLASDGLHLTAARLWALPARPPGFALVGASCHGVEDLARAAALGLDYAFLSPVQASATHPRAMPLGWERFAELVETASLPVYALGGLTPADLDQAISHGAQGIAAIRGLWPS